MRRRVITQKRRNRLRGRSRKSGGGKLSVTAKEFVPTAAPITAKSSEVNMTAEFLKIKEAIENAVAIDCEMVGVGHESALAHVAIVNFNGNQLYNKYVIPQGGIESITNYRTAYSGITPDTLKDLDNDTHGFETVKREVHEILNGRLIVGHGLANDFKALEYKPAPNMVWNTAEIDMYMQPDPYRPGFKRPKKLKVLAKEITGNNIQRTSNIKIGHSPLEDARASMNLYRASLGYPIITYKNMAVA